MQIGMERIQAELQGTEHGKKNMAIISEQFTFMRNKWEEAERDRKARDKSEQRTRNTLCNLSILRA